MAQGWTTLSTVNDRPEQVKTKGKIRKDVTRNVEKKSYIELKKEGQALYEQKQIEEADLKLAYKAKKLKSKKLIKKARNLIEQDKKAAEKAKAKEEKQEKQQ